MDLNASLVDQRVRHLVETHRDALSGGDAKIAGDEANLASRAFVALCVQALLDVPLEEAFERLTDGAHDLAIDALEVDGVRDFEFDVTLFQGKYRKKLDGRGAFPGGDVVKVVQTVAVLFDPDKPIDPRTPLAAQVEEIRSRVRDGYLPRVRVVLCNNGQRWVADGDAHIAAAGFPSEQVSFEHLNHERLIELLRAPRPVDDTLRLSGKDTLEGFDFRRVVVGKMRVTELAELFERHGERLLDRNIRRYLGLRNNRVNQAIAETLRTPERRGDFYFFNNGVTFTCRQFRLNELQSVDHQVWVKDLQVINGGQTCVTIHRTLKGMDPADFANTHVMVRIYELDESDRDVIPAITYATNSQNPVDLRDLRANDDIQRNLELGLRDLGYTYLRKRGQPSEGRPTIKPAEAAEAVMAVVHGKPHIARFQSKALFGPLYETVFDGTVSPAQVAFAVEVMRRVRGARDEGATRAPIHGLPDPPRWLPYGSHHIGASMGAVLKAAKIDHRTFESCRLDFEKSFSDLYPICLDAIDLALTLDQIDVETASLQRLSAAFRRGEFVLRSSLRDYFERKQREMRVALEHLDAIESDSRSHPSEALGEMFLADRRFRLASRDLDKAIALGKRLFSEPLAPE